jgi:hypothetical protein
LLDAKVRQLDADLERNQRESDNVLAEVRAGSTSQLLRDDLKRLEQERTQLLLDRDEAGRTRVARVVLPTAAELKQLYLDAFSNLAVDSYKFARKLRLLVPRIVVFPYQLCDGGPVVLRAKFRLRLAALIPDSATRRVLQGPMSVVLEVDLFEPPQRE